MAKKYHRKDDVYVLGVDYEIMTRIPWQEAVEKIVAGNARPFKVHATDRVRSAGGTVDMAKPEMIILKKWAKEAPHKKVNGDDRASRKDILLRDGRTCRYCGGRATTVDHVKPESRCKKDGDVHDGWTWRNLVAACFDCNNWKANRTPEEAGMEMLWDNNKPVTNRYHNEQKEVWKILKNGEGFIPEEEYLIPA